MKAQNHILKGNKRMQMPTLSRARANREQYDFGRAKATNQCRYFLVWAVSKLIAVDGQLKITEQVPYEQDPNPSPCDIAARFGPCSSSAETRKRASPGKIQRL